MAFGLYFCASIVGSLAPQLVSSVAEVSVPSVGDGLFVGSYALLGLFLWRLGSRSTGADRRDDVLDTLIVVGGVAPLFWVFLVAPVLRSEAPVFDATLHRERLDRHQLERDLRDAVLQNEISVLYQPLVHLPSRDIVWVEALLRWHHPVRGLIGPGEFIPLAEKSGAILDLGDWVLQESLRQLRSWDQSCPRRQLRVMSVNVSPRQLADPEFVDRVARMLRLSGVDPGRLTLEITEATFGADAEPMIGRLHQLKRLGVSLAIDDFGTEYSSLSKLRQMPVDILKMDKSFVDGIATDSSERALAGAIVSLGASLGECTVAEGIETEGQLEQLRRLEVEYGQGYLFSRPVPAEEITRLLCLAPGVVFEPA